MCPHVSATRAQHINNPGFDMSGRRPLIKGYFAALRLIVGAVFGLFDAGHDARWP
jgi:hypothetical protein